MNGSDVRKAREALGWKRPQLAEATGFTVAQIARMELKRPTLEEEPKLKEVLKTELGKVVVGSMAPAESSDPDAEVTLDEWRGLVHGTVVKLDRDIERGKQTTFTFLRYRRTPASEFVELKAKNGGIRTVRPDAVHVKEKGKWVRPS
jgi:transcriptional regulator with XRE-family HTH domain